MTVLDFVYTATVLALLSVFSLLAVSISQRIYKELQEHFIDTREESEYKNG